MTIPQLGRKARSFNPIIPHLSAHLSSRALPPTPDSVDWTRGMPADLGAMLNDKVNDCSIAAFYHALQVWSFNAAGALDTEPDTNVEALYGVVSGYRPSDAPPGPECNMQDVLCHLVKQGAPVGPDGKSVNKLAAFLEIDHRNLDDVRHTIAECGVAYLGVDVPAYILANPMPSVWDVEQQNAEIKGGHAVAAAGYDAQGVRAISAGKVYTLTWAYLTKYTHEAYALADASWIRATGKSPAGLSLDVLERQMQALKG